jgi:hypothetical protein
MDGGGKAARRGSGNACVAQGLLPPHPIRYASSAQCPPIRNSTYPGGFRKIHNLADVFLTPLLHHVYARRGAGPASQGAGQLPGRMDKRFDKPGWPPR